MAEYLLPCPCGRKIVVQPRHAGREVHCECGQSLEVPTLLALKELEQVEQVEVDSGRQWGLPQALVLIGLVILLAGIVSTSWLAAKPPPPLHPGMDEETARRDVEELTPVQSMHVWNVLKQPLLVDVHPAVVKYKYDVFVHRMWLGILASIGVFGGLLAAGGKVLLRRVDSRGEGREEETVPDDSGRE